MITFIKWYIKFMLICCILATLYMIGLIIVEHPVDYMMRSETKTTRRNK